MSVHDHTFVVILAGGGGTRLWPKSREKTPKQFLRLHTENTLMQEAYLRVRKFISPERVIVVTNREYLEETRRLLPEVPISNIIGEPAKRDTAAAMLLGALVAKAKDPEAVIINQASDHILQNDEEFVHVMHTAAEVAASGEKLVTVGISPTFPHTGFGYIQIANELHQVNGLPVFQVANFTEKPDRSTAEDFIATGKYYWNANMYVWKGTALIEAFRQHCPNILARLESLEKTVDTPEFALALEDAYQDVEKISIDYTISEKADNLVLIPGDFGWNDIGDWKVVYDLQDKQADENVVMSEGENGRVMFQDAGKNFIHTNGRLIALVGVENLVVIDTPEIVLVMAKDKSQDVKKIVEKLKAEKAEQYM